jgi:hypothetical protein
MSLMGCASQVAKAKRCSGAGKSTIQHSTPIKSLSLNSLTTACCLRLARHAVYQAMAVRGCASFCKVLATCCQGRQITSQCTCVAKHISGH